MTAASRQGPCSEVACAGPTGDVDPTAADYLKQARAAARRCGAARAGLREPGPGRAGSRAPGLARGVKG